MKRFLWLAYGMYALGGMTSVFLGAMMPELLSHYGVTYTLGGLLVLLQAIGFIVGVPITSLCMKRYHYRFILTGGALAVAVGQIGILLLPPFYVLGFLIILSGIGAASLETSVASYVMELFEGRRAIYMSRLEVAFGLGALLMPAVVSGLIAVHGWRYSSVWLAGFALVLAYLWQRVSISLDSVQEDDGKRDAYSAAAPVFSHRFAKYSLLLLFLVIIFLYVGIEGSLNSFLPSLFAVNLKVSPDYASLTTTVFWTAMLCGRLAIGWIVSKVSYERYLLGSILIASLFFLLLTQMHRLGLCYLVVFGLGLGMSAIYSITMVYANHTFPGMERLVTSSVTAFAGIGGAVFPFIIGYVMDHLLPNQVVWVMTGFNGILLVVFLAIYFSLAILRGTKKEVAGDAPNH
ncbi:MFS transporter [Pullulanibacillus sp. KACC 23026]|uniref:MFS transporter n=1 Tax=Pullulanibacillus sp. KACC 23026 TaxID=3028315 RepID=UPI0023AFF19D|nr:MFS transporter [Pullulanibacillus sp. KACC 23026]WEG14379.1 MFS transporter [Pullulanibacillus sp. KACC 23026]